MLLKIAEWHAVLCLCTLMCAVNACTSRWDAPRLPAPICPPPCLPPLAQFGSLRIFDTPLEAFELAGAAAEQWEAASDGPGAAAEPAGQRTPAQPPAGSAQVGVGGGQRRGSLRPALRIQEGELLYDFCWFPGMSAAEPASCCLATTGRAQPVHLWDAVSGGRWRYGE